MATNCQFKQKKMCKACPFRSNSAPGWLGDYEAEEVINVIRQEIPFFCHDKIDYSDPDWRDTLSEKSHCAGALQMAKTMCKMPRDPAHAAAVKAIVIEDNFIGVPSKFINHHEER